MTSKSPSISGDLVQATPKVFGFDKKGEIEKQVEKGITKVPKGNRESKNEEIKTIKKQLNEKLKSHIKKRIIKKYQSATAEKENKV